MNGILQSAVDVSTAIDIRGTLVRQRNRIDRDLILEELTPLAELKEEPEILSRLNDLFESTSRI